MGYAWNGQERLLGSWFGGEEPAKLVVRSLFFEVAVLRLEGDAIAFFLACNKHEGAKDAFAKFGRVGLVCDEATDRRMCSQKCVMSHKKRTCTRWTKNALVTEPNLCNQKITKVVPSLPNTKLYL